MEPQGEAETRRQAFVLLAQAEGVGRGAVRAARAEEAAALAEREALVGFFVRGEGAPAPDALLLRACTKRNLPMVRAALAEGAAVDWADGDAWNGLIFAAGADHEDGVRALLEAGAAPNARDHKGRTALHAAASAPVARLLLQAGADMSLCDGDGMAALEVHAGKKVSAVADQLRDWPLMHSGAPEAAPAQGNSAVRATPGDAKAGGSKRKLLPEARVKTWGQAYLLVEQAVGVNPTEVEEACARKEAALVESDLIAGFFLDLKSQGHMQRLLRDASRDGNLAVVRRVLVADAFDPRNIIHPVRADVNDRGLTSGESALMLAAAQGDKDVVRALLEAGAAPNATSHNSGCAALHLAFSAPIARLLLEAGADAGLRSDAGETALDFHERWAAKHLFKKHKRRSVAVARAIREWQQQQQP